MKIKSYEKNSLVILLSVFLIVFEIIFITYLIYKKIYTYEKLSGIVMKNNIVLLVIDNDQKKDLYKNKYIYYKDKKTSYKIIKNNGVIITKGG